MAEESENKTRKIGYARVSTSDQNLEMQITALKKYGVTEDLIFTDQMSGATRKRPGFIRAMKTAQHPGTEFVVWKLDRLGRSLLGIIETVQIMAAREVRLVSLTEGLDLGTPMGRMVLHIMGALAEYERELIRERTMAGIKQAKAEGRPHGRPAAMTPERVEKAVEMLAVGANVQREILPALKAIKGPPVSRSALYEWVKGYRALQPPEEDPEDR